MFDKISRFSFPTQITFGPGARKLLPEHLSTLGIDKPLIVTDPGIKNTDILTAIEVVLKKSGVPFAVFSEVQANPYEEDVVSALKAFTSSSCDGVIGLGGGSPLDVAKVVPVLAVNDGPLSRYDVSTGGNLQIKGPLPSVITIPTTSGTGSEVGRCSVITSASQGSKFMVCNPLMMPGQAILDPELVVGLPSALTAYTGMDALTHNIEAFTVEDFHPMCDAIALKGIEFVAQYLERAVKNPGDIEARGYMMMAAMMGAVAFQKDLGAAHSLAHALSSVCGMQHGLANALCLVPVMKFNMEISAHKYAEIARCFGIDTSVMTEMEAAGEAVEAVEDLIDRIAIPACLADAGVAESELPLLCDKAFEDSCHQTNPRPCTKGDLMMLYRQAYGKKTR
ncbi:MAG: iron-containing alcohol dehydrogenase [Deltaproteobacteria bacterium]|nr:iron-containing alcohol dehydrogenase [Deltaproteobacteria bacterium]